MLFNYFPTKDVELRRGLPLNFLNHLGVAFEENENAREEVDLLLVLLLEYVFVKSIGLCVCCRLQQRQHVPKICFQALRHILIHTPPPTNLPSISLPIVYLHHLIEVCRYLF